MSVNRTRIRGILAVSIGSALASGAVLLGPAIANGAVNTVGVSPARVATEAWPMPTVKEMRHLPPKTHRHPRPRHRHAEASRASYRASLSPRTIAHAMLVRRGWSEGQWSCLDALWGRESRWIPTATNASSGAYGIPQALPASKMASAGSDWRTNPVTQISWGLSYIGMKYGTPCTALSHSESYGYY